MARQISRQEYEQLYGAMPEGVVQAVAGNYLSETAFDEAYARLIGQSLSHEDAVRGAQRQVYGETRSLGVGRQGPENVDAIRWQRQRMAGGGGSGRPPAMPPSSPITMPPGPAAAGALRLAGARLPHLLAYALAGTGAAVGGWLSLNDEGGQR
jgi:hypothetical protein